uniref:Serine protease K12H4.7 n=1 Tax=Onchocerca volvulus TaxID=6282 RepID=A0A8R1TQX9_ONCVO
MLLQAFLIFCCSLFYRWKVEANEQTVNFEWKSTVAPRFHLEISQSKNPQNSTYHRPPPPPIGRSSLKQKLDHFNSNDKRKWRQYYIHRKSQHQHPDGTVFLVVGGEDRADRAWLKNQGIPYIQLADQINASIFLLEHRFYGRSRPTNDTSVRNLKYLNAKQAVEDIDKFVQEMNQREKLSNPKWITFGGSNLAAWVRAKHPRSIEAAVASSSPLQAKLNFKEFERYIEKVIEKKNPKCVAIIRRLFQKMRQMSTTLQGRHELVKIFRLDNSLIQPTVSQKDIANFFFVISNYISFIIMHSGINVKDHRDLLTLDVVCDELISSPSLQTMRKLIGLVIATQGKSRHSDIDVSYDSFLKSVREERWNTPNIRPRLWLYQNCHEFGHFRTSENITGLFAGTLPLSFFLARCKDVFGDHFSVEEMESRIAETNQYFGGNQHFQATNVILSNGSNDPWTLLGLYNSTSATGNYIIYIEGTSHAADFYPPTYSDSSALRSAQSRIIQVIEDIVLYS